MPKTGAVVYKVATAPPWAPKATQVSTHTLLCGCGLIVIWSLRALVCWLDEGPVSSDAGDMVRQRSSLVKPPEI